MGQIIPNRDSAGNIIQNENEPFARSSFRTKRAATSSVQTVNINSNATISYVLASERYTIGGAMIVKNAEIGDYIEAWVEDTDGVIPSGYRAATCEAWPIVSTYIEKEFVEVSGSTISIHRINTYPLNAKLTAGLYLKVKYYAVNSGSTREIAINYYLSKRL